LATVAVALGWTLAQSRGQRESWRGPVWAAAGWWGVWALLSVLNGLQATQGQGAVPASLDQVATWVVMLGAIGNVIWAIQARSVPVFYGRRSPNRLTPALELFNLGTILILASALVPWIPLQQVGLGLAGAGTLWLAPLTGAIRGHAHRLRLPSRSAARFVVAANRWAMVAGGCLVGGAISSSWSGSATARFDNAALHGLGLGLATTLIVGMARLVAPAFAVARAATEPGPSTLGFVWLSLFIGTASRLGAALLEGTVPTPWTQGMLALAGILTWIGLALFASSFGRAWLRQASRRAALVESAASRSTAGQGH
jgi:hypothetical protein